MYARHGCNLMSACSLYVTPVTVEMTGTYKLAESKSDLARACLEEAEVQVSSVKSYGERLPSCSLECFHKKCSEYFPVG